MASHSLALCLLSCIQDETRDDDKHADEDDEKVSAHSHDDADKALACRRRQPSPSSVCAASDSALASPQHLGADDDDADRPDKDDKHDPEKVRPRPCVPSAAIERVWAEVEAMSPPAA